MSITSLKRNQSISYFLSFITLGMTSAVLGPALLYLAEFTRSDLNQISILFTAKSAGYLLGSIVSGRLYDRIAGHRMIFTALAGMVITLTLTPMVPLLWVLSLILFLMGTAEGAIDVGGNTLLVWVNRSEVGPYMNGLHLFFGLGTFFSPIILAQSVIHSGSITGGYWLIAIITIPLGLWLLRLPSPLMPTREAGKKGSANPWFIKLIVAFFFLYVGAEVGFGGWVYTYALGMGLADKTTAAYLTSTFWGAFTIGRLFSIPIAARIRPRWILTADLAGSVIAILLILIFPGSKTLLWVATALLGLSMASIFPTIITLAERRMTLTGKTTSWFFVGASAGSMFIPWLIGQIFEPVGPQIMISIVLLSMLAASLLFLILVRSSQSE